MPDERLTEKVFNLDYEIGNNWSRDIKDILYEKGILLILIKSTLIMLKVNVLN